MGQVLPLFLFSFLILALRLLRLRRVRLGFGHFFVSKRRGSPDAKGSFLREREIPEEIDDLVSRDHVPSADRAPGAEPPFLDPADDRGAAGLDQRGQMSGADADIWPR